MSDKTEHPELPQAFAALGVRNSVLKGLAELGYITPSEIQSLLIPKALTGVDLLGQARTGTGKTAAFGIPILCGAEKGRGVQALILTPTRELAVQVDEEIRRIAKHTPIRCISVYGGQKIRGDIIALETNPEIVVGTPGRVIDLLDRRMLWLDDIRFMVLDEVDRMLDIGFRDDIRNILTRLKGMRQESGEANSSGAPQGHQTIFVSATFTEEIERLARRYMREPVEKLVAPGADDKPTVENVEQGYYSVQPWDKYRLLRALLKQEQPDLAIVFCRTKHGAEKLANSLTHDGISCREIHGNLRQSKRDQVMKGFKHGKFDVLVATDLASRGIDVAGISHIINYDAPEDPEVYVHRIGRTARMGAGGKAFTFITREQGDELTRIENMINMIIPPLTIDGFEHRQPPEQRGAPVAPPPVAAEPTVSPKNGMRLGAKMPLRRRRR
ncbi:MAG: DEAD/DEAH box helicase [Burkholderiales bacterium]|nr:DEAD/DEAH box helicase [Phycisphaerae bacterium]